MVRYLIGQKGKLSLVVLIAGLITIAFQATCIKKEAPESYEVVPSTVTLDKHCEEVIGEPRVERISEHTWVALSYDQANTVLIHTDEGNVIVDTAMSPSRARIIKEALSQAAPGGPVKAIIYTHSHIDHIGGTSVWVEEGTQIWATDPFVEHFFKQYGIFRPAETVRAMRQFGHHLDDKTLPCSAIGAQMDIQAALELGLVLPTHTFSGIQILEVGGLKIELHEAHGETHDQLFVWIPEDETLMPGDNFYWAFPNLYTLRGSSPRPVREWIKSLDKMRAKDPQHLVPLHTLPIHGKREIAEALTNYRDAIQWIYAEVVRGANRGDDLDTLKQEIKLPPHLARQRYLMELYGQVGWSVQAIYTNHLGWFDGRPDRLYQLPRKEIARREVLHLGGSEKVHDLAVEALRKGEARWSIHLLTKLKDSGLASGNLAESMIVHLADSYNKLAETIDNTNGRAYLLESALELRHGPFKPGSPTPNKEIVSAIPLELIFSIMPTRLKTEKAMDVYESVHFVFPDEGKRFVVTVRHGIAEVVAGDPLPNTPGPIAVLTADSQTYREIALGIRNRVVAFASGKVKISGSLPGLLKFMSRFQMGI